MQFILPSISPHGQLVACPHCTPSFSLLEYLFAVYDGGQLQDLKVGLHGVDLECQTKTLKTPRIMGPPSLIQQNEGFKSVL